MIIVNNITQAQFAASPGTMVARVSSADEIVAIIVTELQSVGSAIPVVKFNGDNVPVNVSNVLAAGLTVAAIYLVYSPPVGNYPVTITDANMSVATVTVMSLLGVNKRTTTPIGVGTSAGPSLASITLNPQVSSANSIIIDALSQNDATSVVTPNASQTQLMNVGDTGGNNYGASYKYASPGIQSMSWTTTTGNSQSYVALVLEPDDASSIWYPNVQSRSEYDVARKNNLSFGAAGGVTPVPNSVGYYSSTFWQNSFLHTVGRILSPPQTSPPLFLTAETELETSQIVVDKMTQQAVASGSSVTSDHLVTSQDAVMLIFASQMGVSQALNSVNLNGVPLNALGNPSVSTLTAGAYFVVNPNVGINTVSSSVTLPTALELVVITLLGVDKKTTNPIFTANSGLTGSPSSVISPTAANSLIVDFVGSLGTSISENASQTVYFDQPQTASEAAGSIKLSTVGQQTMSWTTLSTAWVQLAVALEPANALSIWYPAIDARNLSDVITVNALDDTTNPVGNFYQTYGSHPTQYWQNSFLHTVGRTTAPAPPVSTQQPLELMLSGMG